MNRPTNSSKRVVVSCSVLLLALAGCGDSLDVKNVDPKGSVGGILVDAITRAPIEGATVSVLAGGEVRDPVTSDALGEFSVNDVPAGDVLLTITPPDGSTYRGLWIRGSLAVDAGEFPAHNTLTVGPIGMIPAGANDFVVRVLDQQGKPVSQYTVTMRHFAEYVDYSSGAGVNKGEVVTSAVTGTDGRATFTNFPDFFALGAGVNDTVVLFLPPLAESGFFDYPGGSQTFSMRTLTDPTPDVILDTAYSTQLTVRASTVPDLAGAGGTNPLPAVIAINDVVHVAFNLPIQNNATVTISDEQGAAISNAPGITISDDNLSINFGNDPLMPGNEYNIHIHAVSAVGEVPVSGDFTASFFTPSINEQVEVVSAVRDPATQIVSIEFSEPIGIKGNGTTSLSGTNCVLFFNADLGGAALIGDSTGELGYDSCALASPYYLRSVEPEPPGVVGKSGYTKFWEFTSPPPSGSAFPTGLPSGTRVHVFFSNVGAASAIVERTDGRPVRDFIDTDSIAIMP